MKATTLLAVCMLAGCDTSADMDWSNYHSSVKERVDRLAYAIDCAGLQAEFDIADANDDAQRRKTGRGNADLMNYIHGKLEVSGCY